MLVLIIISIQSHFIMNFVKNTWKSFFKKQQKTEKQQSSEKEQKKQEKIEQNSNENEQQIPFDILQQLFNLSSELVKQSKKITNDSTKLKIYALYKQSKQGDCHTPKPQMFDLYGKAKWSAWDELRGMKKTTAMMQYVRIVSESDPQISKKIGEHFSGQQQPQTQKKLQVNRHQTLGYQKVQKVDYSDTYTHPYFKLIEKGDQIQNIQHQKLLIKNNEPQVYALHFAIDKERVDLVEKFLQILTKEQINALKDSQGTSILQYAQLIQNQDILKLVRKKLDLQ